MPGAWRVTVAPMNRTGGFSLVECVVATVLLAVGLLAISASFHAAQQLDLLGGRTALGAEVAASRIAALRAAPCAGPLSGTATGLLDERWSVGASGSLRSVVLDVTFRTGTTSHTVRYDGAWLCPP